MRGFKVSAIDQATSAINPPPPPFFNGDSNTAEACGSPPVNLTS